MSRLSDSDYLKDYQYRTPDNYSARVYLHEKYTVAETPWPRWVMDHLRAWLPAQTHILEVGCGLGDLWALNAAQLSPGWRLTLCDLSAGMVTESRSRIGRAGIDSVPGYAVANIEALPFARDQFDGVIANHMLYHVPDRARGLAEVRRVLKAGGVFFASTNGRSHLRELYDLVGLARPELPSPRYPVDYFSLDEGAGELNSLFPKVEVIRYPCELVIDEARPIVDFVLSSPLMGADLSGDNRDAFEARLLKIVHAAIEQGGGAVRIRKDSGLFIAGDG